MAAANDFKPKPEYNPILDIQSIFLGLLTEHQTRNASVLKALADARRDDKSEEELQKVKSEAEAEYLTDFETNYIKRSAYHQFMLTRTPAQIACLHAAAEPAKEYLKGKINKEQGKLDLSNENLTITHIIALRLLLEENYPITAMEFYASTNVDTFPITATVNSHPITSFEEWFLYDALEKNTHISSLLFYSDTLSPSGLKAILSYANKNINLSFLKFVYCDLIGRSMQDFALFLGSHHNNIRHLVLQGCTLTDAELSIFFSGLIKNVSLQHLDLNMTAIGPEGGKKLANVLSVHPSLNKLTLHSTKLDAEAAKQIIEAGKNKLVELDLNYNQLGSMGADAVLNLLSNSSQLLTLDIGNNNFDSNDIMAIATGLRLNTSLTYLTLNGNTAGVKGAKEIAFALKENTTLLRLMFSSNELDAKGVLTLLQVLPKTSLQFIYIGSPRAQFNSGVVQAIIQLLHCHHLPMVSLSLESINPISTEHLNSILQAYQTNHSLILQFPGIGDIERCKKENLKDIGIYEKIEAIANRNADNIERLRHSWSIMSLANAFYSAHPEHALQNSIASLLPNILSMVEIGDGLPIKGKPEKLTSAYSKSKFFQNELHRKAHYISLQQLAAEKQTDIKDFQEKIHNIMQGFDLSSLPKLVPNLIAEYAFEAPTATCEGLMPLATKALKAKAKSAATAVSTHANTAACTALAS